MSLVEAARFHTLSEAEVAASLLRSAGIEASIADAHYGGIFWLEQSALGGYRFSVREEDLADTLALLRSPPAPAAADDDADPEPVAQPLSGQQRVLAAALGLLNPTFGWLATRRRSGPSIAEAGAGTVLSLVLLLGMGGGIVLVALVVIELLTNPP